MQALHDTLWDHLERCDQRAQETADQIGVQSRATADLAAAVGGILKKLEEFNTLAWKGVGAVLLVLLASVASVLLQNFWLHGQTATKQDVAATVAATTASTAMTPAEVQRAVQAALAQPPPSSAPGSEVTH